MARRGSLMLLIGMGMAIVGCVLIAKPFAQEPLWLQWGVGFPLFYIGLPIGIVGAASYFVGYISSPKNPFANPPSRTPGKP